MRNVTLSIDDALLKKSREYASSRGTSLNGLIRQLLAKATETPESHTWFEDFLLVSQQATGNSQGWKFNREEVYDARG